VIFAGSLLGRGGRKFEIEANVFHAPLLKIRAISTFLASRTLKL
jgi:hypothetical protein